MSKNQIEEMAGNEVLFTMPSTEELGSLSTMDTKFQLNVKYKTQEDWQQMKGIPVRAFYMGLKEVPNDEGEMIKCAVFVTEKEVFISAQMVLIDAVMRLPMKTPVEITYIDKKANKTSKGATNLFDVKTLG